MASMETTFERTQTAQGALHAAQGRCAMANVSMPGGCTLNGMMLTCKCRGGAGGAVAQHVYRVLDCQRHATQGRDVLTC